MNRHFIYKISKSRLMALFLSIILVFSMFFSMLFVAENAEHDCIGEDCPICTCIDICKTCLTLFSCGMAAVFFVFFMQSAEKIVKTKTDISVTATLVTKKVRLND